MMQNCVNKMENPLLNAIPEHFTNNAPINSSQSDSHVVTSSSVLESSQNLSFSSAYTVSHLDDSGTHFSLVEDLAESNPITSFTVLNLDDLATTTIYGNKPNAIVRPFRHPEQPPRLQATDSESTSVSQTRHYASLGSSTAQHGRYPRTNGPDERSFAEELNRKLRFLHARETQEPLTRERSITLRNANNQNQSVTKRPLFITTVPTGIFLPPARETPLPTKLRRRIYAYSSRPVVLEGNNKSFRQSYNDSGDKNNNNNNNNVNNKTSFAYSKDKVRKSKFPITSNDKQCTTISAGLPVVRGVGLGRGSEYDDDVDVGGADRSVGKRTIRVGGGGGGDGSGDVNGSNHRIDISERNGVIENTISTNQNARVSRKHQQKNHEQNRTIKERRIAPEPYINVMYDKRVEDVDPFDKAAELRRRNALRKRTKARNPRNVLGSPPPVAGRCHEVIQTEKYLEELFERPPERTVNTQTDLFLEKPPTPPFKPAKVGVDAATEIGEGELFHFDAEAQPIIDILVDACIEQSMLEVAHERELEALRQKQEEFLAQRQAELAELRRLEAEEIRLQAEKERRLRQDVIAKELDDEMQKSVTAAKLLQGHIASLLPEVLENLEPATDVAKKERLMATICPWLSDEVAKEVGHIVQSRELLTIMIQEIIKQRASIYAGYKEEVEEGEGQRIICVEAEEQSEGAEPECYTCSSEKTEECPTTPSENERKE